MNFFSRVFPNKIDNLARVQVLKQQHQHSRKRLEFMHAAARDTCLLFLLDTRPKMSKLCPYFLLLLEIFQLVRMGVE